MPSIEDMLIRIDATTQGLEKNLKKGTRHVNQFERKVNKSASKVDKAFEGVGRNLTRGLIPAVTAIGAGQAIRQAISSLANLSDQADKLGITAERLQELRFAGAEVGIAIQTTDMAMQRFIRRLGEAQNGGGELLGTLEKNNIAIFTQNGELRSSEAVFRDYADLIQNAGTQQERLALAFKAFDSEGAAFVNVLKNGSQGLDEMAASAREMGAIIDNDLVAKAKEFDDAWNRTVLVGKANFAAFLIESTILFEEFVNKTVDGTRSIIEEFQRIGNVTVEPPKMKTDQGEYSAFDPNSAEARTSLFAARMNHDPIGFAERTIAQPKAPVPPPIPDKKLNAHSAARKKQQEEALRLEQEEQDAIMGVLAALEFKNAQILRNARDQDFYNQIRQAGVSADSSEGQKIRALVDSYHNVSEAQDRARETAENFRSVVVDGLGDAIANADNFGDALKNIGLRLAELAVTEGLDMLFSPSAGSAGKSGGGGFDVGSLVGGFADDVGSWFGGFFADGGTPPVGKVSVVGERGPELFVPKSAGTVIPNHAIGGSSVNQVINIDARGADESFLRKWPAMRAEVIDAATEAVASKASRGGSYAKAIGKR